ncbi:glycosyltransferase family 39 protein [bacterium]|nr:glycosyltransferase family 39 protein [bacterium]MCI0607056.1 glycosyltransferase family 39 protein [bacterium]
MVKRKFSLENPTFAALSLLLLTILFSYPAPFHLSDRLIGSGMDAWQFPWNNFVFRQQILGGEDPYYTDSIFFPIGTSLALHSYTEFNSVTGLLFSPFFNDIAQTNLAILLSTFLTAFGTWLLVRDLTKSSVAALFAAIAFAFCPFRMVRMGGHVNFAITQWIPLGLWSFFRLVDTARLRYAAALGFFFALAHYSNQYYSVYLILILGILLLAGMLFLPEWRKITLLRNVLLAAVIGIICLTPILIRFYKDQQAGILRSMDAEDLARKTAVSLDDYVNIGVMNPWIAKHLPREVVRDRYTRLSAGLVALITGSIGFILAIRQRQKLLLLIAGVGIFFMLLSLGPIVGLGSFEFILPYSLLMKIPLINHVRVPTRFSIIVTFCIAILAAYTVLVALRNNSRVAKILIGVLFLLLVVELSPIPVYTLPLTNSHVFHTIGQNPGSSLLTLPYRFDGMASKEVAYQIIHRQKLFNGRVSRVPFQQTRFFSEIPVARIFRRITLDRIVTDSLLKRDSEIAPVFRSLFDLRYVALFPPYSKSNGYETLLLRLFPDAQLLNRGQEILVYELPRLTASVYELRGRDDALSLFLYENWEPDDVKEKRLFVCKKSEARLLLPAVSEKQNLDVELRLLTESRVIHLKLLADETLIREARLEGDRKTIRATINGSQVKDSHRLLTLRFENSDPVGLQFLRFRIQ